MNSFQKSSVNPSNALSAALSPLPRPVPASPDTRAVFQMLPGTPCFAMAAYRAALPLLLTDGISILQGSAQMPPPLQVLAESP